MSGNLAVDPQGIPFTTLEVVRRYDPTDSVAVEGMETCAAKPLLPEVEPSRADSGQVATVSSGSLQSIQVLARDRDILRCFKREQDDRNICD